MAAGADHDRRVGVADHILELGRRMRCRQRHGDAPGEPDAACDDDVGEAGRDEERDSRLGQIGPVPCQLAGDARRRFCEVVVGEHAVSGDDGEAIGSDPSLSPYRNGRSSGGH